MQLQEKRCPMLHVCSLILGTDAGSPMLIEIPSALQRHRVKFMAELDLKTAGSPLRQELPASKHFTVLVSHKGRAQ